MTDDVTPDAPDVKPEPAEDVWFKIKVGDDEYVLPKYNLGDARQIKDLFGVRLDEIDVSDPNFLAGMIFLCKRKARPNDPAAMILREVDAIDIADFIVIDRTADAAAELDPEDEQAPLAPTPQPSEQSPPATSDAAPVVVAPSEPGSESVTTPEPPGSPA